MAIAPVSQRIGGRTSWVADPMAPASRPASATACTTTLAADTSPMTTETATDRRTAGSRTRRRSTGPIALPAALRATPVPAGKLSASAGAGSRGRHGLWPLETPPEHPVGPALVEEDKGGEDRGHHGHDFQGVGM